MRKKVSNYRISCTFLLILFAVLFPSTLFAMRQVSKISKEKVLQNSQTTLANVDNDLQNSIDSIHEIIFLLNQQSQTMSYLQLPNAEYKEEGIRSYRSFLTSLNSVFLLNRNIEAIEVYKCADGACYRFARNKTMQFTASPSWPDDIKSLTGQYTQELQIQPAYLSKDTNSMCYNILTNFKDAASFENIAVFNFVMTASDYAQQLQNNYGDSSNDILYILSPAGGLLYDSTGRYKAEDLPVSELLEKRPNQLTIQGIFYYINYSCKNELSLLSLELIPVAATDAPVRSINRIILLSFVIAAILTAVFTLLLNSVFSRRILLITQALERIRKGDLSVRIPPMPEKDEFADVSESINQMCADLQQYIDRVYLAELDRKNTELKLKSTELRTLQAQINPHFLYNTLEMIRMKLNLEGQRECGDMIMLLSKLLRSSIKSTPVLSLEEELQSAKLFLRLYQLRFPELTVDFALDEEILIYASARNILQPILENCVTHAYREGYPLHVSIEGRHDGEQIRLCISDNGAGIPSPKLAELNSSLAAGTDTAEHIGIFNVNNRLKLLFGPESGLILESSPEQGTRVHVSYKAVRLTEFKEYV
jgi:two-component system sensor histidine kinase YesM